MKKISFYIKNKIREKLKVIGIEINRNKNKEITELADLKEFIKLLHPTKTEHELIRLGSKNDGGYLLPDDIKDIDACFSPGVNYNSDFEIEMTKRGIYCYLADNSVDKPPVQNNKIDFTKKHLSYYNNDEYMTLEQFVKIKYKGENDLILQMDIEGAEYEVLYTCEDQILRKFRIIIIEFHGLDRIIYKNGYKYISKTFEKLLKHFEIIHLHPNNCQSPVEYKDKILIPPTMEITFLRKDRIKSRFKAENFPHKYDSPNVLDREDYPLPKCWYDC